MNSKDAARLSNNSSQRSKCYCCCVFLEKRSPCNDLELFSCCIQVYLRSRSHLLVSGSLLSQQLGDCVDISAALGWARLARSTTTIQYLLTDDRTDRLSQQSHKLNFRVIFKSHVRIEQRTAMVIKVAIICPPINFHSHAVSRQAADGQALELGLEIMTDSADCPS